MSLQIVAVKVAHRYLLCEPGTTFRRRYGQLTALVRAAAGRPVKARSYGGKRQGAMGDFSEDFTLLSTRARMRAELERLSPGSLDHAALTALYDRTTEEIDDRARSAWAKTS